MPTTALGLITPAASAQYDITSFHNPSMETIDDQFDRGTTVASAAAVTVPAEGSFTISGTVTITSFSTVAAGILKRVTFSGALTLTHNATSLILPGSVNIPTVNGDTMLMESLGSGNWRVLVYQQVVAQRRWKEGASIASAAAPAIGTDGNYFHITGTVTITSFSGMVAGTWFVLEFDGALTFTHHATNLDLPGDANITTVAGDVAFMYAKTATTAKCLHYARADGKAVVASASGRLRQRGYAVGVASFTTASTTYVDVTDMSITLTTTANADLVVYANFVCEIATSSPIFTFGFSLDAAAEVGEMTEQLHTNGVDMTIMCYHRFAAVSAAAHTVKLRAKVASSTVTIGDVGTNRKMMLEEISTT